MPLGARQNSYQVEAPRPVGPGPRGRGARRYLSDDGLCPALSLRPPDAALSRDRRAAGGEQRVFGLAGGTERPNLRTVNLAATTGDGGLAPNTPRCGAIE